MAEPTWPGVRALLSAMASNPELAALLENLGPSARAYEKQGVSPEPLIDGNDLLNLGMKPGPTVGRLLHEAYDAQLEGAFEDKKTGLEWLKARQTRE